MRSSASDAPLPAKPFGFQSLAPKCRIGAYSIKGDKVVFLAAAGIEPAQDVPFLFAASVPGCPGKGKNKNAGWLCDQSEPKHHEGIEPSLAAWKAAVLPLNQ